MCFAKISETDCSFFFCFHHVNQTKKYYQLCNLTRNNKIFHFTNDVYILLLSAIYNFLLKLTFFCFRFNQKFLVKLNWSTKKNEILAQSTHDYFKFLYKFNSGTNHRFCNIWAFLEVIGRNNFIRFKQNDFLNS